MIIRIVTYTARPGTDPGKWLEENGEQARRVDGAGRTVFFQSTTDRSRYGAVMYFHSMADLAKYRASDVHREMVASIRRDWLDESQPVEEQVLRVLEH